MYFNVTDITHPPKFVEPTPPNNQRYTIYVGGDFHVNVYAKPTQRDRYLIMLLITKYKPPLRINHTNVCIYVMQFVKSLYFSIVDSLLNSIF